MIPKYIFVALCALFIVTGMASAGSYNTTLLRVGTVLSGNQTVNGVIWDNLSVQEPNVLYDTNPVILNSSTYVFKMWYHGGGFGGQTTESNNVGYAESTNGVNWTYYPNNPLLPYNATHGWGCPFVYEPDSSRGLSYKYYLFVDEMTDSAWGPMDLFGSNDGVTFTLVKYNIVSSGSGWKTTTLGNIAVAWNNQTSQYDMLLEGSSSGGNFKIGLLTSTDIYTWTPYSSSPVLALPGGASGPEMHYINGEWYAWFHGNPSSALPDDIYVAYSTTNMTSWYSVSNNALLNGSNSPGSPVLARSGSAEGEGNSDGQVADPTLVQVNNITYIFYDQIAHALNDPPAAGVHYSQIGLAISNNTLSNMVNWQPSGYHADPQNYLAAYSQYLMVSNHYNVTGELTQDDTGKTFINGGVTINTGTKEFGAGSGYFSSSYTTNITTGIAPSGNYTISAWIYPTSNDVTNGNDIFDIEDSSFTPSHENVMVELDSSPNTGKLRFVLTNDAGTNIGVTESSTALPLNTWTHIVEIANSTTGSIYLNGIFNATVSLSRTGTFTQPGAVIGRFSTTNPGQRYFAGYIDDLNYWNGVAIPDSQLDPYTQEYNSPPLPATIISNTTSGTAPLTVQFNDTSVWPSSTLTNYAWSINNGTQIWVNGTAFSGENISYTFPAVGTYNISLILTNNGLAQNQSANLTITVASSTSPPVANFTYTPTSGTTPLAVSFTDTSATTITAWNWTFGAANFSSLQNPSYTFVGSGNYSVTLNVTNASGTNSITKYVLVTPTIPVASFSTNTTSGTKPLTVAFTDTSTNASTYYWMFGDGNTSTVQSPAFTYNIAGTYTVNHSASNGYTTNWSNQTNLITVLTATDPNPNSMIKYKSGQSTVNINNQTPYVGTGIIRNISSNTTRVISNFTWNPAYVSVSNIRLNQSSVNITGLAIDSSSIGNGYAIVNESKASGFTAPANATFDFNITYVKYATPGTSVPFSFDPSSEYYDPGNGTYWHFNTISGANAIIGVWGPIAANFSASPTTASMGTSITFSDSSTGYPDAWSWNFGDGSTSTLQNPSYAYSAVGNYTVSETAYMSENATVTSTLTRTGYINVTAAPPPAPIAAFVGTPTIVSVGSAVQFADQSLNSPTSWSWVFGDGNGNTQQNPSHVYSVVGNYTVNLTATNAQGSNTLSKTNYIQVVALAAPVAGFTSNVSSGQKPLPVQFTDTSSNMPTSWSWNFGDGNISASQNPSHTFTGIGNYTVNLTAYNAAGNSTATHYINVVTLSGLTRQDLVMAPQYTLTINFVDSSTNLAIPVVKVVNAADGTSVNTTTGTYTGTFGYTTVVLYCHSDGYQAKSVSYVMSSDKTETVQLIESSTQTQGQSVWWTPHTVQLTIMDIYGKRLYNVNVTAIYNQSTMPENWITEMYGVQSTVSSQMVNKTLLMSGVTGSDGTITFTMLGSIGYDFYLTSSTYELDNYYVFAYPSDSMLNIYVVANGQNVPTAGNSTYVALQGSGCVITMPNTSWYNATVYYHDAAGLTTQVNESVWFRSNNTVISEHDVSNPGTAMITFSTLVPNVKGRQYGCGYNFTRSGT
jgi:PKD repeat protein